MASFPVTIAVTGSPTRPLRRGDRQRVHHRQAAQQRGRGPDGGHLLRAGPGDGHRGPERAARRPAVTTGVSSAARPRSPAGSPPARRCSSGWSSSTGGRRRGGRSLFGGGTSGARRSGRLRRRRRASGGGGPGGGLVGGWRSAGACRWLTPPVIELERRDQGLPDRAPSPSPPCGASP